jgi:hypothetical protein
MNAGRETARAVSFTERMSVWFSEFFHHRRTVWIPVASFAGIAAAALLMFNVGQDVRPGLSMPSSADNTWQAGVVQVAAGSEVSLANAAQIDATAYQIADADGTSIGVIWINE